MSQRTSPRCRVFSPPLQGISIRPLIEFINVRRTNRNVGTINVEVHCRVSPRRSEAVGSAERGTLHVCERVSLSRS